MDPQFKPVLLEGQLYTAIVIDFMEVFVELVIFEQRPEVISSNSSENIWGAADIDRGRASAKAGCGERD